MWFFFQNPETCRGGFWQVSGRFPSLMDHTVLSHFDDPGCNMVLSSMLIIPNSQIFILDCRTITFLSLNSLQGITRYLQLWAPQTLKFNKWHRKSCQLLVIFPSREEPLKDRAYMYHINQRVLNRWRKNWIFRCPLKAEKWSFYYIHSTKLWGIIN